MCRPICFLLLFICGGCNQAVESSPEPVGNSMLEVNRIRLYLPDDVFGPRVGNDAQGLADYARALQARADLFWSEHDAEDVQGFFVAIAVKPSGESRMWCDAIEGTIDENMLREFEQDLASVTPVKVQHGPIAFAMEFYFKGSEIMFPVFPSAWVNAGESLEIPDGLFEKIWPDK